MSSSILLLVGGATLCALVKLSSSAAVPSSKTTCAPLEYNDEDTGCRPCVEICHPQRDTMDDCKVQCKGYMDQMILTTTSSKSASKNMEWTTAINTDGEGHELVSSGQSNTQRIVAVTVTVVLCFLAIVCVVGFCLWKHKQCAGYRNKVCAIIDAGQDVAEVTQPDQDNCPTELCVSHRLTVSARCHREIDVDGGAMSALTTADRTDSVV